MSYILDALKKAEAERQRDQANNFQQFATANWDPYQQQRRVSAPLVIAVIIVVAVLLYGAVVLFRTQLSTPLSPELAVQGVVEQPLADDPPADALQQIAPLELQVSGHILLSAGSPHNRLFTDQDTLRVGDSTAGGWQLLAIEKNSALFRHGNRESRIAY